MKKYLLIGCLLSSIQSFCQDDLMSLLDKQNESNINYTTATFKAPRLINGQTIETVSKNHLNFWISHRFGAVNSGFIDNFFGLDEARIRLGLEYGLTDQLTIGVGRSSQEKAYDYYAKYKAIRQSNKVPVTVTAYLSGAAVTAVTGYTMESGSVMKFNDNIERQTYCAQLLIARKFNDRLSLQIMPTVIHFNKTESSDMKNDMVALGFGGRLKLTKRLSLNAEYYLADHSKTTTEQKYHNSLSVGFDIETGGHVFQLHFTNSRGMIERQFIAQTVGQWSNADIFYGFNISRTFSFDGKSKKNN
jgi:Membrane bound beta barrel domain (DUF5777)